MNNRRCCYSLNEQKMITNALLQFKLLSLVVSYVLILLLLIFFTQFIMHFTALYDIFMLLYLVKVALKEKKKNVL